MHELTDYERQYAEQHNALDYRFLHDKRLNINEFYDVVIFRYLATVQRYLSGPQLQQYSFTTIAYAAMNSAVNHYWETEKRRREFCPITDTDYISRVIGTDTHRIEKNQAATLLWAKAAALLTEEELDLITLRSNGVSNREIGGFYGLTGSTISSRIYKIRRRLQMMLNKDDL